jgi:hypothetical protein
MSHLDSVRPMSNRFIAAAIAAAALAAPPLAMARSQASVASPAQAQSAAIVGAAKAFLDSLAVGQRGEAQFPFEPQRIAGVAKSRGGMNGQATFVGEQFGRAVWSNYPVSDVVRPGLRLGSLTKVQRAAAMRLLQTVLSPKGYEKVLEIMGSDEELSKTEKHFAAGEAVYTVAVFGNPSMATPWMLQFGGHHLALNLVVDGASSSLTPMLTGAQPAIYSSNGRQVRVLARENDKAFALLDALDAAQRGRAILAYKVDDLVLGPGHDGVTLAPEGLKASSMTDAQQALLLDLIGEWAGIGNEAYSASRMAEIKAGLADTWFAWSGPTTHAPGRNGAAYYRIQGPRVLIEFSPQGPGGDPTLHVHTIYRDPTNDYGRASSAR